MRKLLLASVALGAAAFIAASAHAQTAPSYNWTGPYAGLNFGYSSGNTKIGYSGSSIGIDPSTSPTGAAGGGQLGYNFQFWGPWVVGLEGDFQDRNASTNLAASTTSIAGSGAAGVANFTTKQGWFGTVRPRFGYAASTPNMNVLMYLTGGLVYGNIQDGYSENATGTPGAVRTFSNSSTRTGWTAGGGAEMALGPIFGINGFVVGAEYLHLDYGSTTISAPAQTIAGVAFAADSARFQDTSDVFRLRLSYRFGVPTPPPAAAPVAAPPAPPPAAVRPAKQMFIVFFEFDKSSLTPDGKKVVDAAAAAFKSGKSDVAVAGYTDLAGTQQYNLALSHRRADAVKAALVKDGVPASAIGESWYGKQNPRVPTADGVREPQNRRVEITM